MTKRAVIPCEEDEEADRVTVRKAPSVAVVIPTYNEAQTLRTSLDSLAAQRFPRSEFEVIVADDGSSDRTMDVVSSFSGRLQVKYHFQPDEGFHVTAARNAGARLSSAPVLVFLDTGTLAGPDFVRAHHDLHSAPGSHAVIGYTYGYQPWRDNAELERVIHDMTPAQIVERFHDEPWLWDWRHEQLVESDLDVNERAVPWILFQGMNCSLRAEDFWAVGGFDEEIRHWGTEDMEIGFRLRQRHIPFVVGREAWALELPGPRDMEFRIRDVKANAWYFLGKHHEPVAELLWRNLLAEDLWQIEDEYQAVLDWTEKARGLDVRSEIEDGISESADKPVRVAIFGCGAELPSALPPSTLVDFDRSLLDQGLADGRHRGDHAIGIRTPLRDQSVDLVIITSRLSGLWERWGDDILAEARRIGRNVRGPMAPVS
jgi:glycosyltransferase involved in cell wall biosynthesis